MDLSFSLTMKKPAKLRQCHAGAVTCLESSPVSGLLLSGGEDGRVCVYDLERGTMVNSVRYSSGVSCMLWLPLALDRSGSQLIIGFSDGVIRLYSVASGSAAGSSLMKLMKSLSVRMKLLQALKPHRTGVTALCLAPEHRLLASAGRDRTVYLYTLLPGEGVFQLQPLGYFQMEDSVTSIVFQRDPTSCVLLVALASHSLLLLQLSSLATSGPGALALPLATHCTATIQLPGVLQLEPGLSLLTASYSQDRPDTVLLVFSSQEATQLAELVVGEAGAVASSSCLSLPRPPRRATVSRVRWLGDGFLLLGHDNGVFRVMDVRRPDDLSTWSQGLNDPATGQVTDMLPLTSVLVTSGRDGTLFTHSLGGALLEVGQRLEEQDEAKQGWRGLSGKAGFKTNVLDTSNFDNVHDIEDPNHLCLEDMRLKEGEEKTNKLMEDKMLRIQKDVSNLKRDFKKIQQRNENLQREYQVPKDKFQMTDFTYRIIQEEIEMKMKEVVKSRETETEESKKVLENIRQRFFDPIQCSRVVVKGLKSKQELTTFRIAKMVAGEGGKEVAQDSILVLQETPESWTPRSPREGGEAGEEEAASNTDLSSGREQLSHV